MLFLLTPTALAQNSRPQQDCCFLIWSTARYLGWSTALFFNTQIRERWVQYDWTMVEQLEGAMHSIKGVERSCSEARWDDCEEKILWLQNLIRSFQKNPTSGNRRSIFNAILNTYKWGIQLKRQVYHYQGQTYETAFSTCAEKYYSLGFCLATAAQLFRHADENARLRGRKWQWWYDQNILSARSWLQEAQAVLGGYREVTTGECVALPVQSYYNIITDIKRSANRQQNLQSWIQGVEKVMNDAGQRLRMQCLASNLHPLDESGDGATFGGVKFHHGQRAFADRVEAFRAGKGTAKGHDDPRNALGFPGKNSGASKRNTSLGDQGILIVSFSGVRLVDRQGADIYVFERGPEVEPFRVEISANGRNWINLGIVSGQPTKLDIAGKGPRGGKYQYVRITDAGSGKSPRPYAGADIDAVGAINAVRR
jgi:hypothetical protein